MDRVGRNTSECHSSFRALKCHKSINHQSLRPETSDRGCKVVHLTARCQVRTKAISYSLYEKDFSLSLFLSLLKNKKVISGLRPVLYFHRPCPFIRGEIALCSERKSSQNRNATILRAPCDEMPR